MTSRNAKSNAANNNAAHFAHIPFIKIKDNAKQLPTYNAVLQRTNEDYVAAEDLDKIQADLETLLSNVAVRCRVLKSEIESLDKDDRRNERRSKHAANAEKAPASPATQTTTGKRKRDDNVAVLTRKPKSSVKQIKIEKKSPSPTPTPQQSDDSNDAIPTVAANTSTVTAVQERNGEHHTPKVTLPKNDTPNKFWLSVEPYCMPITNEDLRLIDDLLEHYKEPLVPPIPELGTHYATVWAKEDLKDAQQASNANISRLKQSNEAAAMVKKADAMIDECVTGSLTQRFMSALMEEQLITFPPELVANAVDTSNSTSSSDTRSSAQVNFRSLSMMRNCIGIEHRIKQELIKEGMLDAVENEEDEVLAEIKRLTNELSAIADYNSKALKQLHSTAAGEIKRLEVKRKLDVIDQEILETYKRTVQNKAKRKTITVEEQKEIIRLTNEQKVLSDHLQRVGATAELINAIKIEKELKRAMILKKTKELKEAKEAIEARKATEINETQDINVTPDIKEAAEIYAANLEDDTEIKQDKNLVGS